jgi:hypothetical protein
MMNTIEKFHIYKETANGNHLNDMDTIARNARCLLTKQPVYRKQVLFITKHHNIYTVEIKIIALSAHGDKLFIL